MSHSTKKEGLVPHEGFWRRQFSAARTARQLTYDILLGIVLPFLAFWADPIVFNTQLLGLDMNHGISHYKSFTYVFSVVAIVALATYLLGLQSKPHLNGIFAGVFFSGAAVCVLIGIWILPLTLLGLFMLLGVFGFLPFFTAFAYLRNGVRALHKSRQQSARGSIWATAMIGVMLAAGPAALAQWKISRGVDQLIIDSSRGDADAVAAGIRRLRYFAWAADLDPMSVAYSAGLDEGNKRLLAQA